MAFGHSNAQMPNLTEYTDTQKQSPLQFVIKAVSKAPLVAPDATTATDGESAPQDKMAKRSTHTAQAPLAYL